MILLISGLGNSGKKYNNTRHNIGFKTIDQLQENWKTIYNFSEWKLSPKFNGELSEGKIAKKKSYPNETDDIYEQFRRCR